MGHNGMSHAAKAMAVTAAQLIDDPDLVARARDEFAQATDGYTYRAPIPEGGEPPKLHGCATCWTLHQHPARNRELIGIIASVAVTTRQ